jgi:hypothetical protein
MNNKMIYNDEIINIGEIFYKLLNGNLKFGELNVLQRRQKEINEGRYFGLSSIVTIPANSKLSIAGETSNKYIHIVPPTLKTSQPTVTINIYEGVVYSGGENAKIFNHNRNFPSTIEDSKWNDMKSGVTISSYGDINFYTDFIPGATGVGGKSSGGDSKEIEEWIFKPNTKYGMDIINGSGEANKIFVYYAWYWTNDMTGGI